jgi:hypothetical protein
MKKIPKTIKMSEALRMLTAHVSKTKGVKDALLFHMNHMQGIWDYFGEGTVKKTTLRSRAIMEKKPANINDENFTLCNCNSEMVLLKKFEEDKEINLMIYTIGQYVPKPNLWQRLKYCWYHLSTGKRYEDQIVLDYEKAQSISEWLFCNAQ